MTNANAKRQMRAWAAEWRDSLPQEERKGRSSAIWKNFFALPEVQKACTIMLFSSIGSEVDTSEALERVLRSGHRLVLPRVNKADQSIQAREVHRLEELEVSSFGILEPTADAPPVDPFGIDAVGVPGLVFDRIGYRIGYGGGYYDRFLPLLRSDALIAGIGFSGQRVHRLPRTANDYRVRCLVTENGVVRQPLWRVPDRSYKGVIFDLDGTVYRGEALIPGAKEAIEHLRQQAGVVFLSNKPLNTRADYAAKLNSLGVPTDPDEVINSSFVLATYLTKRYPGATVFCVSEPPLIGELQEAGFRAVADPAEADYRVDVVVAAFDRTFDYEKLNNAYQCLKRGARFVATNADRTCPVEGGEIPDCAAMIGAIEGASGVSPEIVVGKPNPLTAEAALAKLGVDPADCLMVGDRVETDVRMGLIAGTETALVLSGVSKATCIDREGIYPHFVIDSIAALLEI